MKTTVITASLAATAFPEPQAKENVSVRSKFGTLHGTLDLPESEFPVPVVLIIAGSGPTDRDGNSEMIKKKNDSLKMLGAHLASMGIASLRYDKRGIGKSKSASGPVEETVFEDMISDARLWVDYLLKYTRFSSVGIIGHSEGSLVGMCAAAEEGLPLSDNLVAVLEAYFNNQGWI